MSNYRFSPGIDVEDVLLASFDTKLIMPNEPGDGPGTIRYFQSGDRMLVDPKNGMIEWDPIEPGRVTTSLLSMKLHFWFAKGMIRAI